MQKRKDSFEQKIFWNAKTHQNSDTTLHSAICQTEVSSEIMGRPGKRWVEDGERGGGSHEQIIVTYSEVGDTEHSIGTLHTQDTQMFRNVMWCKIINFLNITCYEASIQRMESNSVLKFSKKHSLSSNVTIELIILLPIQTVQIQISLSTSPNLADILCRLPQFLMENAKL
jgi:hypothetical protein